MALIGFLCMAILLVLTVVLFGIPMLWLLKKGILVVCVFRLALAILRGISGRK